MTGHQKLFVAILVLSAVLIAWGLWLARDNNREQ